MEKDKAKSDFFMMWNSHPRHGMKRWCFLMERRMLVDVEIFCSTKIMYAHKCLLAANSNYFKEEFDRSPTVKQIILSGLDFPVVKALIEYIYCGETQIREEYVKYAIAAARLLQISGIDLMFSDHEEYHLADDIYIPHPQFIRGGAKYSRDCNTPNIFCRTAENKKKSFLKKLNEEQRPEGIQDIPIETSKIIQPMQVIDFIEKQKQNVFNLINISNPTEPAQFAGEKVCTFQQQGELDETKNSNPDLLTEIMETTKIFLRDQQIDNRNGEKFTFSTIEPEVNEKKPIQFMLVDNVVFSDGTLGSNGGIKVRAETKFANHVNNEDDRRIEENLEFSPDMFFADPISCDSELNV